MTRLSIIVTAGPTFEFIDPVRFISNRSTGAMGIAIARAAKNKGHKVFLIGPGENLTAVQMQKKVLRTFKTADAIVMAAAVADYRPLKISSSKIKKTAKSINLKLVKNPDILEALGKHKGNKILVGFALETENFYKNAHQKLKKKNLDFIVANRLTKKQNVFGENKTSVLIIDKYGDKEYLENQSKKVIAERIIKKIEQIKSTWV